MEPMLEASAPVTTLPEKSLLARSLTLAVVILPLLGTVFAIVQLWQREVVGIDLVMLVALYLIGGFGITIGYHRFATHRSFRAPAAVEFILLAMGSLALEGDVIQWTADHWKHHKHADREGDPHSPLEGFFHAHVGWFFGRNRGVPAEDARHLVRDPVARFVSRTFFVWVALGFVIPFMIDGWRGLIWGGLVRTFVVHHITWSVNSICHLFGRREFQTPDSSGNQWIVGLIGLGEGWHNNHHAFPESAFHGLHWYQIDLSAYVIRGMERLHLVSDVRRVSPERMQRRRLAG